MHRRAIGWLGFLAMFGWSAAAEATPSARLVYGRGPASDGCPDEAELRRSVAARVGYDPFFPYTSRSVVLTLRGTARQLTARIEVVENEQATARELSAATGACDELVESAALAIAIAIDPRALAGPVTPPPDPSPATRATLFLAVGGRAGVELPLSAAAALRLDGDLVGDLDRPALKVGSQALWQPPVVAGVLALSTSVHFE